LVCSAGFVQMDDGTIKLTEYSMAAEQPDR
jgi:hypothetical protein